MCWKISMRSISIATFFEKIKVKTSNDYRKHRKNEINIWWILASFIRLRRKNYISFYKSKMLFPWFLLKRKYERRKGFIISQIENQQRKRHTNRFNKQRLLMIHTCQQIRDDNLDFLPNDLFFIWHNKTIKYSSKAITLIELNKKRYA